MARPVVIVVALALLAAACSDSAGPTALDIDDPSSLALDAAALGPGWETTTELEPIDPDQAVIVCDEYPEALPTLPPRAWRAEYENQDEEVGVGLTVVEFDSDSDADAYLQMWVRFAEPCEGDSLSSLAIERSQWSPSAPGSLGVLLEVVSEERVLGQWAAVLGLGDVVAVVFAGGGGPAGRPWADLALERVRERAQG